MKIWYQNEAKTWNEALPIGNGHVAGMVYGHPIKEVIQLNDETVWYRGKSDRNNPDSLAHLAEIRQHLLEGRVKEAEDLVKLTMFATPRDQSHYELLGELFIEHIDLDEQSITDYRRSLSLETACATVEFQHGGAHFKREYFTSFTRNVMICRISSSEKGKVNLNINLGRLKRFNDEIGAYDQQAIVMKGKAGGSNGVAFQTVCQAVSSDGQIAVLGETLTVRNSTSLVLILKSATNFWEPIDEQILRQEISSFSEGDFDKEYEQHLAFYQGQFCRMDLQLGEDTINLPTDQLLLHPDCYEQELLQLLFHYGRYLLISSSQPGGLPSNLQGIWCEDLNPIWGSKYTININTQMNYWLTGPCNLPEVAYPLFDHMERMREQGRVTATKMYGARGFTAHHNTDGFGDTAPQSHAMGAAIWVLTVPWLCTHIWEHYIYFRDKAILEEHIDLLKEAFLFFEDYLFEKDGYLLTGPTVSPENQFRLPNGVEGHVCLSSTIDNQILRYFCQVCIEIAELLEDKSDFSERVRAVQEKLPQTQIGRYGQIQEWLEDYEEVELGHRHISPLFGLYPANEIDIVTTPELAAAAKRTLERRLANTQFVDSSDRNQAIQDWLGAGLHASTQTGWSAAWLVHFFARLRMGEAALGQLKGLLEKATLPNLFLDHPPFQIDGNLGLVSGICELLVQSHREQIELLPALPEKWTEGAVKGIRTRTGLTVSFEWENQRVKVVKIEGGETQQQVSLVSYYKGYVDQTLVLTCEYDGQVEYVF